MASGPTQNYDDATLGTWQPRPLLAGTVRVLAPLLPALLALAVGLATARWLPPERLGMHPWLWLLAQVALSTALVLLATRWTRRLLPLSTLLRMTLVFPDRAPSRFAVARRTWSPEVLETWLERTRSARQPGEAPDPAALVLELVAALGAHDEVTFKHSERVQAYAALVATEMGLSREDAAKLGWAALLHDVGKLHVPADVLTSTSRPSPGEWAVLTTHPHEGMELARPLAEWLGPWLDAIGQHHERWDGGGYPAGLAGTSISLGARVVAVADAYDVITSARSYKEPLSAAAAREELARCAGTQFDPDVVHAFLRVGLGRLRIVAGPLSVLSGLPGLRHVPTPDLGSAATTVASALPVSSAAATSAAVGATLAVTGAIAPLPAAAEVAQDTVVEQVDRTVTDTADDAPAGVPWSPTTWPPTAPPRSLPTPTVLPTPTAPAGAERIPGPPELPAAADRGAGPPDDLPDPATSGSSGKPAGTPGTPGKPAGTPGTPAGTPGTPAGTPGKPAGTPGKPADAPSSPADDGPPATPPGKPAGGNGRPTPPSGPGKPEAPEPKDGGPPAPAPGKGRGRG
ncbi:HD domain-containing protein [Cellulomonas sp. APG4]|uniref:HD domain-containing phosphohydrolase n=1 Tax=Cellulomonas sp. APG4 TaxID=1538656 RepID=UPI00137A80FF|nr:HD domain-containing phosphohydrolase [Cellulomonas sp. APG4]NCT91528.1 HD domain-containing protein [Cellulomonas sp. APG4]